MSTSWASWATSASSSAYLPAPSVVRVSGATEAEGFAAVGLDPWAPASEEGLHAAFPRATSPRTIPALALMENLTLTDGARVSPFSSPVSNARYAQPPSFIGCWGYPRNAAGVGKGCHGHCLRVDG